MSAFRNDQWFTEIASEGGMALSLKTERKLHEEKTEYQTIEVYETTHFGNMMVIDGYLMLTARDNFIYHEMMSHPALYTHANAKRVVIIGGGDCGTLHEVLKHPEVEEVVQVEIDERVTRLAEQYFPELCETNDDPRARLEFTDGIAWMREAEAGSVDVVIVDSTDPFGPAEGLFNQPFYESCLAALKSGGLLVQQSESPLIHRDLIRSMHDHMRGAGFNAIRTLNFPQPTYPTGWWSATLARKDANLDGFRERAASDRPFRTEYYSAAVHRAALEMPVFLKERIEAAAPSENHPGSGA